MFTRFKGDDKRPIWEIAIEIGRRALWHYSIDKLHEEAETNLAVLHEWRAHIVRRWIISGICGLAVALCGVAGMWWRSMRQEATTPPAPQQIQYQGKELPAEEPYEPKFRRVDDDEIWFE